MDSAMYRSPRLSVPQTVILVVIAATAAAIVVTVAGPMLGIAMIGAIVALAAAAFTPGIVFAAYLLIPFYKGALQDYSPIDLTVVVAGLNALQIFPLILDRRRRTISRSGIALWLALPILVLAGVLYSPDQSVAIGDAASHWGLVVLPILPAALRVGRDDRYVREFLWTFFGLAVLVVLLGVPQFSSGDRLVVLGMNTIQVGRIVLLVPVLAVAFVLWQGRPLIGLIAVLTIPFAIVVALATGSRGPLVALAVIGGFALVRFLAKPGQARKSAGRIIAIAAASIVVVAITLPILPAASTGRFTNLAEFIEGGIEGGPKVAGETSAAARVDLYGIAVNLFDRNPAFGAGTRSFAVLSPNSLDPAQGAAYPHNAILQIAAEFGFAGVAFFIAVVLLALTRALPPDASSKAVRALFVFFLINAMFSGDIVSDRMTLGLLMLVLVIEVPRRISVYAPAAPPTVSEPSLGGAALQAPGSA